MRGFCHADRAVQFSRANQPLNAEHLETPITVGKGPMPPKGECPAVRGSTAKTGNLVLLIFLRDWTALDFVCQGRAITLILREWVNGQ